MKCKVLSHGIYIQDMRVPPSKVHILFLKQVKSKVNVTMLTLLIRKGSRQRLHIIYNVHHSSIKSYSMRKVMVKVSVICFKIGLNSRVKVTRNTKMKYKSQITHNQRYCARFKFLTDRTKTIPHTANSHERIQL